MGAARVAGMGAGWGVLEDGGSAMARMVNPPSVDRSPIPIALNYHLYKPCNYRCRFCFAAYRDTEGHLPELGGGYARAGA